MSYCHLQADNGSISVALTPTIENVLPFYVAKANTGHRVCLVTQFNVDDVAPRPVGSQIAVSEDGDSYGFITGGCAEAAIVHEALMALKENQSRCIRIGADSPWFDIKLPCGAGIELHFSVADSRAVVEQACRILARRRPVTLKLNVADDGLGIVPDNQQTLRTERGDFSKSYLPHRQLNIIGAGPYVNALESLAKQSEFQVSCWSPEFDAVNTTLPELNGEAGSESQHRHLARSTKLSLEQFDAWTAVVLLFHEHDWEPKLLEDILKTDCFYIGALGSRKTHTARLEQLRKRGISEAERRRIHGPVGLSIGAKTPAEIALSILSEIVAEYHSAVVQRKDV